MKLKAFQADFELEPAMPWDAAWDIPSAGRHRTRNAWAAWPAAG